MTSTVACLNERINPAFVTIQICDFSHDGSLLTVVVATSVLPTAKYYVSLSYCDDRAMDRATVSATYALECCRLAYKAL